MTHALATVETLLMLPAPAPTIEEHHAAAVEAVRRVAPTASVYVRQEYVAYGHAQQEAPTRNWEVSVVIDGRGFCAMRPDFDTALSDAILKVKDAINACPYCGRR